MARRVRAMAELGGRTRPRVWSSGAMTSTSISSRLGAYSEARGPVAEEQAAGFAKRGHVGVCGPPVANKGRTADAGDRHRYPVTHPRSGLRP